MLRERERTRERERCPLVRALCTQVWCVCERETGRERKKKRERDASLERAVWRHRCVMKVRERENA